MDADSRNRICENIEAVRKERKISKKKLSKLIGTSAVAVSRQTSGSVNMSVDYIIRYAEALGCSPAAFFDGTFDRKKYSVETDITHMYPYNLACAVIGYRENLTDEERMDIAYGTYVPEFMLAIKEGLKERERLVVEYRFKNLMTLDEIGKEFGLTRERIRQIEAKALRKLRGTKYKRNWDIRKMPEIFEKAGKYEAVAAENEELKARIEDYKKKIADMSGADTAKEDISSDMSICELEMSVRSYNCLRSYGIEKVKAVTLLSPDDLMCIRNLGKGCVKDIGNALGRYGLTLCGDGKDAEGTVGALKLRNDWYRPYIMIALRGAEIFTLDELSHVTKNRLAKIIAGSKDMIYNDRAQGDVALAEIVKAAARAGIRIR